MWCDGLGRKKIPRHLVVGGGTVNLTSAPGPGYSQRFSEIFSDLTVTGP